LKARKAFHTLRTKLYDKLSEPQVGATRSLVESGKLKHSGNWNVPTRCLVGVECMRIALYADNTLPVALGPLCEVLGSVCKTLTFEAGTSTLRIPTPVISKPETFKELPAALLAATRNSDLTILCTAVPYENNFFYEQYGKTVILSFYGWHVLTNLPISNGIAYFLTSIVADLTSMGSTHQKNTGCLNDFWWNKQGVDVGMRAAFLCPACIDEYKGDRALLEDVHRLLDLVSTASRRERDVLNAGVAPGRQVAFDVFLCHNGEDKPAVRDVNATLKRTGIRTWLDEEQLPLGTPWQAELEKQISQVAAAAVFVGRSGLGPWQGAEMRAFLTEFLDRGCPVIPVLLPGSSEVPQLPVFLKQMTWLDLRHNFDQGMTRLADAVRHPREVPRK
jgi:hypothetical protein